MKHQNFLQRIVCRSYGRLVVLLALLVMADRANFSSGATVIGNGMDAIGNAFVNWFDDSHWSGGILSAAGVTTRSVMAHDDFITTNFHYRIKQRIKISFH